MIFHFKKKLKEKTDYYLFSAGDLNEESLFNIFYDFNYHIGL